MGFTTIQFLSAVELLKLEEVVGAERFADAVFLAEPFAEIDQLAARGAERAGGFGKIFRRLAADRAGDFAFRFHWRRGGQSDQTVLPATMVRTARPLSCQP